MNAMIKEGNAVWTDKKTSYDLPCITLIFPIDHKKNSVHLQELMEKIQKEIAQRVENICRAGLNGKNTITAINEYALSVINYYIGAVPIEYAEYSKIDADVRKIFLLF